MATRSLTQRCVLSLLLILLAGCVANHYEIELSPDAEGLRRQLKVQRGSNDNEQAFDQKELEAISRIYGVPTPEKLTKIPPFAARFVDRMPQDVGGAGWYVPLHTPLGSAYGYTERFRSTIDLVALVEDHNSSIDRGVNHLLAWLKTEIGSEPYAGKAAAALDTQLRRDLKNLVLYTLAGSLPVDDKNQGQNLLMRVAAYLAERGYFQPKELPALFRAFGDAQRGEGARLAEFAMRWLATQSGIAPDQPLPERLKQLTSPDVLLASLRKYAETTSDYGKLLAKWEIEKKSQPDKSKPHALDVFFPDFRIGNLVGSADRLELRLRAQVAPHTTNGAWSAEKMMVTWSQPIAEAKSPQQWPILCYAFWSEPDAK